MVVSFRATTLPEQHSNGFISNQKDQRAMDTKKPVGTGGPFTGTTVENTFGTR
jgi:hypothetical protein